MNDMTETLIRVEQKIDKLIKTLEEIDQNLDQSEELFNSESKKSVDSD